MEERQVLERTFRLDWEGAIIPFSPFKFKVFYEKVRHLESLLNFSEIRVNPSLRIEEKMDGIRMQVL